MYIILKKLTERSFFQKISRQVLLACSTSDSTVAVTVTAEPSPGVAAPAAVAPAAGSRSCSGGCEACPMCSAHHQCCCRQPPTAVGIIVAATANRMKTSTVIFTCCAIERPTAATDLLVRPCFQLLCCSSALDDTWTNYYLGRALLVRFDKNNRILNVLVIQSKVCTTWLGQHKYLFTTPGPHKQ